MKIVRVLWGNDSKILSEIPSPPIFKDEEVIVWGKENSKYLSNLGYKTILVSNEDKYLNYNKRFYHKLEALTIADSLFKEYLLLDWDVTLNKNIDNNFFRLIKKGNNIQCPLYSDYPLNYEELSIKKMRKKGINSPILDTYVKGISKHLKNYSWLFYDYYIIPNFCFFYSNNAKIGKDLLNIANNEKIETNVEEFSLFKYLNCSLEDYIKKYSPEVLYGNERVPNKIKNYISNFKPKDIYLKHDI